MVIKLSYLNKYLILCYLILSYHIQHCHTVSHKITATASFPSTQVDRGNMDDIKRAFERYDVNGDGSISHMEAHQVLHDELGFDPDKTRKMIQVYDRNGDGRLSYEEFIWFYWKIHEK